MRDQPKKMRFYFSESIVETTHFLFKAAAKEGITVGFVSGCFLSYILLSIFEIALAEITPENYQLLGS